MSAVDNDETSLQRTPLYAESIVRLLEAFDSLPDDRHRLSLAEFAEMYAAERQRMN